MVVENFEWAFSAEKRPIPMFCSEVQERPILFIGGVHGDEPEGVALAEGLLAWLKTNSLRHTPPPTSWALIPCLNPDGFLRRRRTNGNGVDLNRNYPSQDWSPESRGARYFPGLQPGSESEIQALVKWIKQVQPRLIVHFHSWKPCIVYNCEAAFLAAQEFERVSGYSVTPDIGYPTPGSLSRFGQEHEIPVICIEERDPSPRHSVWPRFKPAFEKLLFQPFELGLS